MELFKIVKDKEKSLREVSTPVTFPLDQKIETTLSDMLLYLKLSQDEAYAKKHKLRAGVGLAAPQIGLNKQMIALFYEDENGVQKEYMLINPKIISESVRLAYLESGEGCLSVDKDYRGYVYRHYKVTVKAYDLAKKEDVTYTFIGFGAIVIQHEIDHLKGILFYDHINKVNPFEIKDAVKI